MDVPEIYSPLKSRAIGVRQGVPILSVAGRRLTIYQQDLRDCSSSQIKRHMRLT